MDSLSINKLQNVKNNQKVSFKGQKSVIDSTGIKKYHFYAPPFDKSKYDIVLEFAPLKYEKDNKGNNTGKIITSGEPLLLLDTLIPLNTNLSVDIEDDSPMLPDSDMIGYRFVLIDTEKFKRTKNFKASKAGYMLDTAAAADGDNGKFSYFSKKQGFVNKTGPMYHIFPDAYNVKDKEDFSRNHFNKAGGTISGMIEKIMESEGELEPYEIIISTPLFGGDDVSSHGYWNANPYQISTTKGNLEDFKKLQTTLFDMGKTYVADGAFTSQGFQGPQFQNVLKWGKQSPNYYWFKLDRPEAPNTNIKPGVLPDTVVFKNRDKNSKEYKRAQYMRDNIAFRIVNPKYIEARRDSAPGDVIKNPKYDKKKATYLQFYDKRFAGKFANDIENLIITYPKDTLDNHYEVTEHQDSTMPYYFIVNPDDNRFKTKGASLKDLDEKGYISQDGELRWGYDSFLEMDHFTITTKGQSGGFTSWDGSGDLAKMNISSPTSNERDIIGNKQVKNNYYNVGKYWTKVTDNALLEHIAGKLSNDRDEFVYSIMPKYNIDPFDMDDLYDEVAAISNQTFENQIKNRNLPDVLAEGIADFPLESVGFAADLIGTLSTDFVTPRPKNIHDDEKNSRSTFIDNLPSNAKNLYREDMYKYSMSVLGALDEKMPSDKKLFDQTSSVPRLTPYGKIITDLALSDIMRFGVVKSLFPDEEVDYDRQTKSPVFDKDLQFRGLNSLGINEQHPEFEAEAVVRKMRAGFKELAAQPNEEFIDVLYERFANIELEDYKIARAIMDKTGAGLNWRFDAAKDVADLDQRRAQNPHITFENCWDDAIDFWGNFIENVREVNPASYVIAEVTNLWEFSRWQGSSKNNVVKRDIHKFNNLCEADINKLNAEKDELIKENAKEETHRSVKVMNNGRMREIAKEIEEIHKFEEKYQRYLALKFFKDNKDTFGTGNVSKETQEAVAKINSENLRHNIFDITTEQFEELKQYYMDDNIGKDVMFRKDFGKYIDPNIAERMFYEKTGATTGSNYSTFFGLYPELYGQNFEHGTVDGYRLHNMSAFQNATKDFFKSNPGQFIKSNHIFLNNHDKPRPLHCLALDMEMFLGNLQSKEDRERARVLTGSTDYDTISSMAVAVGEAHLKMFKNSCKRVGINENSPEMATIKQAIADLTVGKFLNYTEPDMQRSRTFGFLPLEITMKDVILQARYLSQTQNMKWSLSSDKKPNDKELSIKELKLYDETAKELIPALNKLSSMWEMMCCTVGVPTLFAGDELGQTGYETPTKNVELAIRNVIQHDWLIDPDKKFVQDFNQRMTAASKLHKRKELSALADGEPMVVPQDGNLAALYKYNNTGSEVLIVYSNKQMENGGNTDKERAMAPINPNAVDKVSSINLGYIDPNQEDKGVMGSVAKDGSIFKRVKYNPKTGKYEEDNRQYIVKQGKLYTKTNVGPYGTKITSDTPIELDSVTNVFFKVK